MARDLITYRRKRLVMEDENDDVPPPPSISTLHVLVWRVKNLTLPCLLIRTSSLLQLAPLEAVLFDVDGTLCDTDPLHYYAFREMLQEIGFNGGVPITEDFFVENIAGKHNEDIACVLFPNDHERGVKFLEDKEAMFRSVKYRIVKEKLEPIKGLYKLTKWIEDRGLKRAAVTNAPRENAELMISMLGLSDFFHAVILGSDCERAKPFPDPYLKALEVLKVSKEHTCVFEDSVSGIKAGVAAGMPTVGLTTRNPAHLLMEAKPAFLIRDYEDPKLWSVLDELDKRVGVKSGAD
ncbi:hypothetical protein DH2020_020283 [Rehmannia glutinosa]|uniref:Haloacid dehalogenase-like hydrolase domain-containing protein Sgpp n=1 Tax=Rehmannia glutinosa TaxID=99300 RepID=A0ABR0WJ80_REHGL